MSANGLPATILIIRHGEKPDAKGNPHLSALGRRRAEMIAQTFPAMFHKLSMLFATAPSKDSNRPYETLEPLSDALNLRINKSFADDEHSHLAKKLLADATDYAGKTILICWHHEKIPKLARDDFGQASAPKKWPDEVFDQIWQIDYAADGRATFNVKQQPPISAG